MKTKVSKQDNWKCNGCGKEVEDLYFTEDGREICSSCRNQQKKEK